MKRTLGLSSIIILVLMLLVAGCGEPDDTEAPEVDPEEEAAEEEVAVEEEEDAAAEEDEEVVEDEDAVYFDSDHYVLPESFPDFVATFKEIRYTGGDVGGAETTVHYEHIEVEEVDGVQTDKVEFSVDGEVFTLWVDSEGNFQRVIADGEELPIEIAQPLAEPIKDASMAPFYHTSAIDVEYVFRRDIPGYEQNIVKTETETFGDMTATVYTVEASVGPPAVEEALSASATMQIADFGDFQAIISWETTEPYEGASKGFLRIDDFVLR